MSEEKKNGARGSFKFPGDGLEGQVRQGLHALMASDSKESIELRRRLRELADGCYRSGSNALAYAEQGLKKIYQECFVCPILIVSEGDQTKASSKEQLVLVCDRKEGIQRVFFKERELKLTDTQLAEINKQLASEEASSSSQAKLRKVYVEILSAAGVLPLPSPSVIKKFVSPAQGSHVLFFVLAQYYVRCGCHLRGKEFITNKVEFEWEGILEKLSRELVPLFFRISEEGSSRNRLLSSDPNLDLQVFNSSQMMLPSCLYLEEDATSVFLRIFDIPEPRRIEIDNESIAKDARDFLKRRKDGFAVEPNFAKKLHLTLMTEYLHYPPNPHSDLSSKWFIPPPADFSNALPVGKVRQIFSSARKVQGVKVALLPPKGRVEHVRTKLSARWLRGAKLSMVAGGLIVGAAIVLAPFTFGASIPFAFFIVATLGGLGCLGFIAGFLAGQMSTRQHMRFSLGSVLVIGMCACLVLAPFTFGASLWAGVLVSVVGLCLGGGMMHVLSGVNPKPDPLGSLPLSSSAVEANMPQERSDPAEVVASSYGGVATDYESSLPLIPDVKGGVS